MAAEAAFSDLSAPANEAAATAWLQSVGVKDTRRGHQDLVGLRNAGITADLADTLGSLLSEHLGQTSDPGAALNNLQRFVAAVRSPVSLIALLERDPQALPTLLQIFSHSQYLADVLIGDPDSLDVLRLTEGQPVARAMLVDELSADINHATDAAQVMQMLWAFKQRETLRIAYGDFLRRLPLERTTEQLSFVAEAIIEAALRWSRQRLALRRGEPRRSDGQPARIVVLGLGKLGGAELDYSSDIALLFLSEPARATDGPQPITADEFFDRLVRDVMKLITTGDTQGPGYRVDLRLRPHGADGPLVTTTPDALRYYDLMGRTWQRQAFVKARIVAGDASLGDEFLEQLRPWIYRRYLNRADIAGIRALKRKIESRSRRSGDEARNVKTGHGGIRDVEFVIQFLQLLNGGDLLPVRVGNTLRAIAALEQVGCLTMRERTLLSDHYAFLRRIEHHLQIMFDLHAHTLPHDPDDLARLAWRLGYHGADRQPNLEAFQNDLRQAQTANRKVLDHLMHDAFGDSDTIAIETELVLDPEPETETLRETFVRYGFVDPEQAYEHLLQLARESISFLSTRRCRHFLAAIAPKLLAEIARTPDPDQTLLTLVNVTDSLGGKGALWELFSFTPPTLRLVVRLCACSPYLSGILTSNPGMIDELLDSLLLDRLPTLEESEATSVELCRGAEDLQPIMHSFKNAAHLCVGVRDILGKEDIQATHRALADTAEICLRRVAEHEQERLAQRYGDPVDPQGRSSELMMVAVGKLGAREPNYHSDLEVIFLYSAEGQTQRRVGGRRTTTTNSHFFNELTQQILKRFNGGSSHDRLYELYARLRPTGGGSILAIPVDELVRYFHIGQGQLWERLAFCKARCISGSAPAAATAIAAIRTILGGTEWRPAMADEIRQLRLRMEQTASPENLKRGPGGTVDVEYIVQTLQLKHAAAHPEILEPGTLPALERLRDAGLLDADAQQRLSSGYRTLRRIESNLRLMNTAARHELPTDPHELRKLNFLTEASTAATPPGGLAEQCRNVRRQNRTIFDAIFDQLVRS